MARLTLEQVKTAARSVAARNVGYSHPGVLDNKNAKYTYPDGSHCIVGAVAEGLGLPLPSTTSNINGSTINKYLNWLENQDRSFCVDRTAVLYLEGLQKQTDLGIYWDQAVAALG